MKTLIQLLVLLLISEQAFAQNSTTDQEILKLSKDKWQWMADKNVDKLRPALPRYQPDAIKANWVMVDTLAAFGNQRGLTPAQVALAWLLAQKPFIVPIPGTTKLAHLRENIWSVDYEFTDGEMTKLTEEVSRIKIVGD